MIPAAVGFQCPECVAEGQAQTRPPMTPMGGAIVRRAVVTQVLIGICVAVFILQYLAGFDAVVGTYAMQPAAVALGGEWWRLLTAAFLHLSILHILFNMYVLYLIGPELEALFGHVRFLIVYLLAAVGGSIASFAFGPFLVPSAGASGAIFGLMAALIVAGHSLRRDVTQVIVLLGVNIVIGFLVPNIDWRAHLGGAVVGAAAAAVMAYAPRQSRVLWQSLGVLAICGALVAAMSLRTAQLTPATTGSAAQARVPGAIVHSSSTTGGQLTHL